MDIRLDYLKNETIFYSNKRSERPNNFNINVEQARQDVTCPFCKQNESVMAESVYKNEKTGIRIVKNKYPSVDEEHGVHEVLIESYDHDMQLDSMDEKFIFEILKVMKNRLLQIEQEEIINSVQIFKNTGSKSGASLEHSHWQILGLDFVPKTLQTINRQFEEYKKENENCFLCEGKDIIKIIEDDEIVVGIPHAHASAKSFRIYPKKHITSFSQANNEFLSCFASALAKCIWILKTMDKNISYNIIFYSKPIKREKENFHFFVDVIGRRGTYGGFEFATGSYVSSELPEDFYLKVKEILEV